MDLGNENSELKFVEYNEKLVNNSREFKVESNGNGNCVVDEKQNEVVEGSVKSRSLVIGKSVASSPSPSPGGTIGHGLKKWRRIKRGVNTEGGVSNVDNIKLMKRGLPNSSGNLDRGLRFSGGVVLNSEGSVSLTNATVRSPGNVVDVFAAIGDSGIGNVLGIGMDSEYSEDRSSKSSTAASAPKMRYEMSVGKGFANRLRNLSGKNLGNSGHRGQPGKVRTETSKKLRGDMVKIEKENYHSSMESDSRSSNFVFMQGINSTTSNGRQSGRSSNYDGENSDEAQGSERQPSEELPGSSSRKNGGQFEDNFQEDLAADSPWGIKEENSENNGPSGDQDPLFESILTLQSVEEALEKEIKKFGEIGMEESAPDELVQDDSSEQLQFGYFDEKSFDSSESEVVSLTQSVNLLESKLDDAKAFLEVKEAKIIELQESILGSRSPKVETECALELHQENYRDIETELEGLFKQKIEAEVECLAISRTVQNLRVAVVDQITTLEEQKKEQARMLNKLGDAEVKAAMLKGEAVKLENYCEDIVSSEETIIKLKTRIYKYTSCFLIQLMLLLVILSLFVWQLSPNYSEVVPT
ncbi:hypothetical protein ACH5RR_038147 [Cinchona calisaya]|uniref:WPP domain-interacting protein 1 n=1 Tax=Cinchona calisaya TaxID=153742 RepID=A0ABD2Y881_9GENT